MEMRPITIVGCGPGAADHVIPAAQSAIAEADVLVGTRRLLDLFPDTAAETIAVNSDITACLDAITERAQQQRIAVLVTGDPGLCSLAAPVIQRFGREACRVIAGVSSVHAAFAALGLDWLNARILSAHHRPPALDPATLATEPLIALLGGNSSHLEWVTQTIESLLGTHDIFLCENMTLPDESITHLYATDSLHNLSPRSLFIFTQKSPAP